MVTFLNPDTAAKYECTSTADHSVIVQGIFPQYRGKVSKATPEACEQMIKEGVPFIRVKAVKKD